MKRSEFIRTTLLSLIAVGSGFLIVPDSPPCIEAKRKYCVCFKVSNDLLADKEAFDAVLKAELDSVKVPEGYELSQIEMGQVGGDEFTPPDFVLDLFTVLLTYR